MSNEVVRSLHKHVCRIDDNKHSYTSTLPQIGTHSIPSIAILEGFWKEFPSWLISYFSLRWLWCHDLSQYQHPPTKHALLIILLQSKPSKILWYCIVVSRLVDHWQSLHPEFFCHCFPLLSTTTSTQSFQSIWNQCKYFGDKLASQNETHLHNFIR